MDFLQTFRIAIESLLINRLRSILTTLGIIIGVGAVIGLVSLGRAVENYIAGEFNALGSNILQVASSPPRSPTRDRVEPLTSKEARDIANPAIAPSVLEVATEYTLFGQIVGGTETVTAPIRGVSNNYGLIRNWAVQSGEFITTEHINTTARVVVLGLDVVEDLFGDRNYDPVGQQVRLNQRTFTVIGVMSQRGGTFISEDNVAIIPITTAQTRLDNARTPDGSYRVTTIYVKARDEDTLPSATEEVTQYLSEAHGIVFADEQDFSITTSSDLLGIVNQVSGVLTVFLAMIAGISLLVGGIGIMNIMLVSVTERTREIGLRKALGARRGDILTQFLIESVVLSLVGGIFGIAVGWIASIVGTALIPNLQMTVEIDAVFLAISVSTFVGVFFGYYPAQRAASMKPIDALRFE
jgi:putative ABC transport system permease protein